MKIGITQLVLGGASLADTLSLCEEAGYEAVELVFHEDKDLNVAMSPTELADVKERCAESGVEISSVIAHYAERGNLLSRQPAERDACCRSLERALQIAGALGADGVLLHPGQLGADGTYEQAWNDLRGALREMIPVATEHRAAICLENVWNRFLLSPREARQFVDDVDSPWMGIYLDSANMMAYGYPEQWIRELGSRIKKVHFKDFLRGEHRFVNLLEGDTDWPTVMAELRAAAYGSTLIHEVGGDHRTLVELAARMRRIHAM